MLTRNRNLTEGSSISPPHNSNKDEQTNHHNDNYFCRKNQNNSVPSWDFECQHGSKECVGNLLEVFLSVILIHQTTVSLSSIISFCKSILTPKCQGVRDGSHGLGLPSLPARHLLHGGFRQQQRSNSQLSSS